MRRSGLAACCIAGLLLVGCADEAPAPPIRFADLHFSAADPPIRLDVVSIEVVDRFQPSFQPPEVEQDFPVPPQRAIRNWVQDRLQAGDPGSPNRARVIIADAAVRETDLMPGEGLGAAFTDEQSKRYDAHLAVRIEILDARGKVVRTANAETSRSRSVAEDTTLNERDRVWYDMTRDMVQDLGGELQKQVESAFYPYLL
jgi:hypothetical protein